MSHSYIIPRDLRKMRSHFRVHYRIFWQMFAFFVFFLHFLHNSVEIWLKTIFLTHFTIIRPNSTKIIFIRFITLCKNFYLHYGSLYTIYCSAKVSKNNVYVFPNCLYPGIIHAAFFFRICRISLRWSAFFLNLAAVLSLFCRIFLKSIIIPVQQLRRESGKLLWLTVCMYDLYIITVYYTY